MNKCTILIIDNEENRMIKINPISFAILEPVLKTNEHIVEQTLHIEYYSEKGLEYIPDTVGYFAKAFMKVKEGVEI